MRLNRYLASTLLTGLFVTATMLTPAMGQEQSLKPQGAWAIAKVDRVAQGGNSYCTLSRKYDDGVVLSLGRNQTEEYSLAIDFQKDVFEKGKSLKINLQPGPGQIRAYDLMPASEKALVIRLGWDTGFFDTLNKSQQMKVKIADKQYTFAMPEITQGQGDLQSCMEGLKSAAKDARGEQSAAATTDVLSADPTGGKDFNAGKTADKVAVAASASSAAPAPAPVADVAAQEEQVAAQEKSLLGRFASSIKAQEDNASDAAPKRRNFGSRATSDADDVAEVAAAQKPVEQPRREKPVPPPPIAEAKAPELVARPAQSAAPTPLPVVADAAKAVAKEAPKAVAEVAPSAAKMAAVSPAAAFEKSEAETKALQKQIDDLMSQNKALQQQAAAPSADTQKKLDALQVEKAALEQKVDTLQKSTATAPKASDLADAKARAAEMEARNAQLEDNLRNAQVRIAEAAVNTESRSVQRIVDLETKLQAAQNDNNALAKQLESFRLQKEDKSLVAVAGDWDLEQATKRYNEAEREIRRLGLQLEQERTSCNREKAQIEQMLFDPAVADQRQIERLSQLEADLKAAQAKVADTQKMVQDQVNQQVAAQVAQKTQSLEASNAAMTAQLAGLQKSLTDRDASVATLQKSAGEAQVAMADKAKLAQDVADLQKIMAARDAALALKDQEIAALKAAPKADPAQVTALQAQVKSMTDAMVTKDKALADALASNDKSIAEAATARNTALAQKDQEIAALKAVPKADPAQVTALQAQIKAMTDAMAAKDKAVIDAQNAARTANAAQAAAMAEAAKPKVDPAMQAQMAELQKSTAAIRADNDVLRDQNIVLRQEADKLRLQLTDAATNGGARADQVASLQLQIDTMKRQAATKDTQLATYQNQLASLQQESTQLKNRLSVADTSRSASSDEVGSLTRQIQQLQRQVSEMQAEKVRAPARTSSAETYAGITPAAGYVSANAVPVATIPAVQAQPIAAPVTAAAAPPSMAGYDRNAIQSLLQKSGLNVNGVAKATSGFAGADNFNWTDSSNVRGLASVKMLGGARFETMIDQYITYQKGQCAGDFASMPSPTNGGAGKKMAMYEIACVGANGQNQSASLVFFEDQGRFIAIANQIDAANMDIAMDSRDRIAGFIRGL